MGRRSRKRPAPPPAERREPPAAAGPRTPPPPMSRRARLEEAPKPPWHPFPLVELCILGGLVLMVVGFVKGGNRGGLLAICGIALVAIGVGAVVFLVAFLALRAAFRRRAGGMAFRA